MKETKVYMELPENCFECPFMTDNQEGYDGCFCKILDERAETKNRLKDCQLIDIKTHDREVVKEVCEKIKNNVNDMPYYDDRTGYVSPTDVCEMIDELQKEFEK